MRSMLFPAIKPKHLTNWTLTLPKIGQVEIILKYVGKRRDVYVDEVDHRGTSQTCPNCRIEVRKKLEDRIHSCPECFYEVDRDIASAQEIST